MADRDDDQTHPPSGPPGPEDSTRIDPPFPVTPPPRPVGAGGRIGHYHLRRLIGSGGMGVVYEAMQEQPRRVVALKVMRPGVASPAALRRFEYESQVLARLHHPGIAQIFEAGTHRETPASEPVPYFAMEFIPLATPLTEYATERGLATAARLGLMSRVCDAVAHGHSRGIIHRDLKPSNILVDAQGNPKVIDFGVARGTDSDLALTTLQTSAGQIIGTLQYMSPEQCSADPRALDHRSDIYSLGIILYELVCGKLPYDVGTGPISDATRIIRETTPARPSTVNREVRGDLETIILRAIDKDRERRYQSAAELKSDIDRFLAGEPIRARPDSLVYVVRSHGRAWVGRNRAITVLIAILAAAALAQTLGPPLFFRWTGANRAFEVFCTTLLPRRIAELKHVRLIEISDSTDLTAVADAAGVTGVAPTDPPSLRRLHGKLMERLAAARPAVVAFDIKFRAPSRFDADMAAGAGALAAAGVDAVVGYPGWNLGADGLPELSPELARAMRWGSVAAPVGEASPWRIFLAMKRGDEEPRLSLALRTLLSAHHAGMDAWVEVDPGAEEVRARAKRPGAPGANDYVGLPIVVPLSVRPWDLGTATAGLQPGDLVAAYQVDPPPTPVYQRATVDYAQVMKADPARLRDWFAGRTVIIYDGRTGVDRVGHPSGRTLPGAYCHAAGLEQLFRGDAVRTPGLLATWLLALAGAAVGALLAAGGGGPRWLLLTVVLITAAPLTLAVYALGHLLISPYVPALAGVLGACLSARIPPARHTARP